MSSRINSRHRAAVRTKTPLSAIAESVASNAGTVGRRTAVLAASSALVVSMSVTAADAAPLTGEPEAVSTGAGKAGSLLAVSSTALKAPADATVTLASASVASATPKPKPKPVVQPERTTTEVSRSEERPVAPELGNLSATRANIISVAARYLGTPYRYGGTTPAGFDCSGYVQYVFNQVGVSLPRTSSQQGASGTRIPRSEALPGDLVYKPGHVGIYAGDNMMYHSPQTGDVVSLRELYSADFVFIRVL